MVKPVFGRLTKLLNEKEAPNQEGVTREIWNRTKISGKPILVKHNWAEPGPVGKFKRSWVEQDKTTGHYFGCIEGEIDDSPAGVQAVKDIDSGVLHSWSVSVIQGNLALGPADLNREVLEGSLVPDPQEQGTQVVIRHSADGKTVPVQNLSLQLYTVQDTEVGGSSTPPKVVEVPPSAEKEVKEASTSTDHAKPLEKPPVVSSEPEKKAEKTEQNPVDTRAEMTDPPKEVVQTPPAVAVPVVDTPMADAKTVESATQASAQTTTTKTAADQAAVPKKAAASTPQINAGTLKVNPPATKKAEEKKKEAATETADDVISEKKEEEGDQEMEDVEESPVAEPPKKPAPALKPNLKVNTKPAAEKKAPAAAAPAPTEAAESAEQQQQQASTPVDIAAKLAAVAKSDPEVANILRELRQKQVEQEEYISKIKAENEKREAEAREVATKERAAEHEAWVNSFKNRGKELTPEQLDVSMQVFQSDDPAMNMVKGMFVDTVLENEALHEELQALKKSRVERPRATGETPQFSADVLTEALKRVDPSAVPQSASELKRKSVTIKTGSEKVAAPAIKPGQKIYSHSKSASSSTPVANSWAAAMLSKPYSYDPAATVQSQAKLREQYKVTIPSNN
jgi:hypothetical protein